MKHSTLALFLALIATSVAQVGGEKIVPERLTFEQARIYMLDLINRDRATKGLRPVQMDAVASSAGQKHAEEMATHAFLSHHNRDGKLPDQRYTEAGGQGVVLENVYLATSGDANSTEGRSLVSEPVFRKADIEYIQAAYFNQIPPNDYHRRNILEPRHTHVGVGLAVAGEGRRTVLANAQEFVARYVDVQPIPSEAAVEAVIPVRGRVHDGFEFYSVEVSREDLPARKELSELRRSGPYRTPASHTSYYPDHLERSNRMTVNSDGSFEAAVRLTDDGRPGLYYVRVRVRDKDGDKIWGSQRTIVVRAAVTKAAGEGK